MVPSKLSAPARLRARTSLLLISGTRRTRSSMLVKGICSTVQLHACGCAALFAEKLCFSEEGGKGFAAMPPLNEDGGGAAEVKVASPVRQASPQIERQSRECRSRSATIFLPISSRKPRT